MTFFVSLELFHNFVMFINRTRQANIIFIKGRYCVDKVASVLNKPHHRSRRWKWR